MDATKSARVLQVSSIALFVASLACKAIPAYGGTLDFQGLLLLAFGWMGLLGLPAVANLAWLANPVLLVSWILLVQRLPSCLIWACVAAALTLLPIIFGTAAIDESGSPRPLGTLHLGYWLWVMAAATNVTGSIAFRRSLAVGSLEAA